MSKALFAAARELIEQKKYKEARLLLKSIDHPIAREWLLKLDAVDPPQRSSMGMGIVIVSVLLIVLCTVGGFIVLQSQQRHQQALQSTLAASTRQVSLATDAAAQEEMQVMFDSAATQRSVMATIMAASPTPSVTPTETPTPSATDVPLFPSPSPLPPQTQLNSAPDSSGKWIVDANTSAFDDSVTVTLLLEADEPVYAWRIMVHPVLALRCMNGVLDVFVATHAQLETGFGEEFNLHLVRVRYDQEQVEIREMDESTDSQALFFLNPELEIQLMQAHNRLAVGYVPYNTGEVEALFDLRGLSSVIQPLWVACPPYTLPMT